MQKISSLEGGRGVLAMAVFLGHSWSTFIAPLSGDVQTDARSAVALVACEAVLGFFVLSGFVIALSIDANRRRNGRFDALEYMNSRLLRILPPILFAIAVAWLLALVLSGIGAARIDVPGAERSVFETSPQQQFLSLATLAAWGDLNWGVNGPLWSLEWEIKLYTVAGLLACAASFKGLRRIAAWLALLAYALALGYANIETFLGSMWFFLFFGAGFAVARMDEASLAPSKLLALAAVMSALTGFLALRDGGFLSIRSLWSNPALAAISAMWFALALAALRRSRFLAFLAPLGGISYTLYILHFPLLQAIYFVLVCHAPQTLERPFLWVTWPCAAVLTFVLCAVAGRLVERPAQQRLALQGFLQRLRLIAGRAA